MSRNFELLQKADHDDWSNGDGNLLPADPVRFFSRRSLPQLPPLPGSAAGSIDWHRIRETIQKYWKLSAIFASAAVITALLITLLTTPVYESTAKVEINPPGTDFSMERTGTDSSADYLETQAQNMQSDQLLIAVIRQLHLDKEPEFTEKGFVARMTSRLLSVLERTPSHVQSRKSSESGTDSPDSEVLSANEVAALSSLHSQLSVKRDTASRLVAISFASHDPALSANVTNAVVRLFIDRTYQTRHEGIMQSTQWLSRQLDDIRAKMEESNRALTGFQQYSGITDIDENRSTFTEEISELSRQKTQAQAERIQIESFLRRARANGDANLPQVQNNTVVQALTQRLGEVRSELAQALAVYGKNYPNTKKLHNQVEELELQVRLQSNAIVGQMENSYAAALAREQMIDSQMKGTSRELGQMAHYAALKKEAQANSDLYNALYAKVKEAGITAASKSINIRIVDQARVLGSPTKPRALLNLGLALFVGVIGGLLLIFVRQAMDTRVHTLEDVRDLIGLSSVSMVPITEKNAHAFGSLTSILSGTRPQSVNGPAKFLLEEPSSEQSEAFRGIHTSIMLSRPGDPPRVLLVSSSLAGEGKSTVAVNLAVARAEQGKTCILDADLRRPSIARAFRITPVCGLSEYLMGSVALESIITPAAGIPALTVVSAGKAMADPGRLINSKNMRLLVSTLRKLYDFIVIDSPPILPYADGRALAPFVDGVVFVGRAGVITRGAMARSLELLQKVHSAPVLEIVLNATVMKSEAYGYGYKYKYMYPTNI